MDDDLPSSSLVMKRRKRASNSMQMQKPVQSSKPVSPNQEPDQPPEASVKSARIWEPWSSQSVSLFHEALKMHGKDFESIRKFIASKSKPEGHKSYDQVRNFYQNTYKKISAQVNLSEACIPEEAKQLFVLINLGEWQKKVQIGQKKAQEIKPKALPKFRELILKGSTTVKVGKKGGKAQQKFIRTPLCNALRKFCEETKDPIKELPNKVIIELLPKTYGDKAYILDCEQNPYIRLEAAPSRPLKPYFGFLKRKWISADDKQRIALLGRDMSEFLPEITLFPSKYTTLTATKIRAQTTNMPLCVEKCQQFIEKKKITSAKMSLPNTSANAIAVEKRKETDEQDPSDSAGNSVSPEKKIEEVTNVFTPFGIRQGITEDSVQTATVGELCLVCNSAPIVKLCYSIEQRKKHPENTVAESPEPWKCLMRLLAREYGENLQKALAARDSARIQPPSSEFAIPANTTPLRSKKKGQKSLEEKAVPATPPAAPPDKVANENRAFELQYGALLGKRNSDVYCTKVARRKLVGSGQVASSGEAVPSTQFPCLSTAYQVTTGGVQFKLPSGEPAYLIPQTNVSHEAPQTEENRKKSSTGESGSYFGTNKNWPESTRPKRGNSDKTATPHTTEARPLDFSAMAIETTRVEVGTPTHSTAPNDFSEFTLTSPEKRIVAIPSQDSRNRQYLESCADGIVDMMNMDTNDFSQQMAQQSGNLDTPKKRNYCE